ncbi:MAG: indole-3-glycerol phosphate synthase TrpC [Breznakibacter sp.]
MNILDKIIARKFEEVAAAKELVSIADLEDSACFDMDCPSLRASLLDPAKTGIIAEFKRRSPSKGVINDTAQVPDVAKGYEEAGVSGISILTDTDFFGGSRADLIQGCTSVAVPILRKDFMVDVYQVFEAKSWGASAILLIAAVLTKAKARELGSMAKALGMDVLMEVHNREELDMINEYVDIVGVNNRDLKTFHVSLDRSVELAASMPSGTVKISESGIYSVERYPFFTPTRLPGLSDRRELYAHGRSRDGVQGVFGKVEVLSEGFCVQNFKAIQQSTD